MEKRALDAEKDSTEKMDAQKPDPPRNCGWLGGFRIQLPDMLGHV